MSLQAKGRQAGGGDNCQIRDNLKEAGLAR